MQKISPSDTIVAQSTPVGEGAIGVIRLSGPRSMELLAQIFRGKKKPEEFESHRFYLGKIIERGRGDEKVLDQVLTVWMDRSHSFTGEEVVEIHTHGSQVVINEIIRHLISLGARLAEPGEFSKRAFLNGKIDLSQAEAIADLIHAKSEWQAKNALAQLGGVLSRTIQSLKERLIKLSSLVEIRFDFSEDIEIIEREKIIDELKVVHNEIKTLVLSFETGQLFRDGLRVVLIGSPNVGKSSLLNVLINEDRAIVHEVPGTTRDVIYGERKIHGINTVFYDTAGIREAAHPVENEGIKRSQETLTKADLVLLILDSSRDLTDKDFELIRQTESRPRIIIYSKCDLPPVWEPSPSPFPPPLEGGGNGRGLSDSPVLKVSSKEKIGIEELIETIYDIQLKNKIESDHNYVLNNVRHKSLLVEIERQLEEVTSRFSQRDLPDDCLAEELRIMINLLGEITGEITNEHVLDEIFSRFCIGK